MHGNLRGMLKVKPENDQIGKYIGEIGKKTKNFKIYNFIKKLTTYLKIDNLCSFRISDKAIKPGIIHTRIGSF